MPHEDPWASWFRLYEDWWRPFVLSPAFIAAFALAWFLPPAVAWVVALPAVAYWMFLGVKAVRAKLLMYFWKCPKCDEKFLVWPYWICVFSDNRCGHCGARSGEG